MKKEKQEGLVFTNEKCIGCNKCISVCPVITANKAVDEDGKQIIQVDGDKCISCGACFDACEHGAREFRDDTETFFEDLKNARLSFRRCSSDNSMACCTAAIALSKSFTLPKAMLKIS